MHTYCWWLPAEKKHGGGGQMERGGRLMSGWVGLDEVAGHHIQLLVSVLESIHSWHSTFQQEVGTMSDPAGGGWLHV